jgi:hypothetical protein
VGSGGLEAEAKPIVSMVRSQKAKVSYSVVLAAQASCVDHFDVRAVSVNCAAHLWPTIEVGSEGSVNGNESVRVSVEEGEGEAVVPGQ